MPNLDKIDEARIMDKIHQGNKAEEAQLYFGEWLDHKLTKATSALLDCSTPEEFFTCKQRVALLKEFKRDMELEIQSGELAYSDFEIIQRSTKLN